MESNTLSFDASPWAGHEINCPYALLSELFNFAHLYEFKHYLTSAMSYNYKSKVYCKKDPGRILTIYVVLHSLLRVGYVLQVQGETYRVEETTPIPKDIGLGALTPKEFQNPFLVFQEAFAGNTLDEFDLAWYEIVLFSLSPSTETITWDLFNPYSHLIKMLDASWLIHVRGIQPV
ncbi:MAG: hypothetical protein WA749_08125 [Gelidibacter sp.]